MEDTLVFTAICALEIQKWQPMDHPKCLLNLLNKFSMRHGISLNHIQIGYCIVIDRVYLPNNNHNAPIRIDRFLSDSD